MLLYVYINQSCISKFKFDVRLLQVQIFITKEEKMALGIQENVTTSWRKQNNIPDSGFHKALKLTKETDLTQYPQLILTSMMAKDTTRVYSRVDSILYL